MHERAAYMGGPLKNEISLGAHDTKLGERRSARAPSPEIDNPLSGERDQQLLASRPTRRRIGQRRAPFFQSDVAALIKEQAPRTLHQHRSQSGIAVLRDAALESMGAGRVFAGHETGETGDLPAIAEAL